MVNEPFPCRDLWQSFGVFFGVYFYPFHVEILPRIPVCSSPVANLVDSILLSDCLFLSLVFQKESFALYALYSKNKPQSDALFVSHGQPFFKVRIQGVTKWRR